MKIKHKLFGTVAEVADGTVLSADWVAVPEKKTSK